MKILQVNVTYNSGSTGKIVHDLHVELLRDGFSSVVCYGRGNKTTESNVYKTCSELYSKANNLLSRFTGLMYGGCHLSTSKLIRIIKKEQPDVVHLHCLNGYFVNIYRLISWLKHYQIKTILTLHAELMHTANCGHAFECEQWMTGCKHCKRYKKETKSILLNGTHRSWKKMKRAFEGFTEATVASVSPWLQARAARSPILKSRLHQTVLNGLDTKIFTLTPSTLKQDLSIGDKKMVFHATPNFNNDPTNIKGGYYVLQLAQQMKDVAFVVAGPYDTDITIPKNVILLGNVNDQTTLAAYYSAADLTLLCSKRETFSMIVAESLSCGTPVVGFEAGAPEQITLHEHSRFVPFGNIEALKCAVQEFLSTPHNKAVICAAAHEKYDKRTMYEAYLSCYHALCNNSKQ